MIDSEKILKKVIENINIIDEKDIPSIDLYMDQITTFMDKHLAKSKRFDDDKILTKTMINNYAKNNLLPSPVKKRYSKEHVIFLIFIYYFKSYLSINDIKTILEPLANEYFDNSSDITIEEIYDCVCSMENMLQPKIEEDILSKIQMSKEYFSDTSSKKKDYLQLYMLISALSFDVYVKKQMIESLVDKMNRTSGKDNGKNNKSNKEKKDSKKES